MSSFKKTLQPILQPILSSSLNSVGATSGLSLTAQVQAMFAVAGREGFMYDYMDKSKLFQLSNGTTAVVTNSDPIGYVTDLSGKGHHGTQATAGSRPLWNAATGGWTST